MKRRKTNPHPYVVWRDGRPRFTPSPELRARGFKGKDLKHEDGRWLTRGEAVDWSIAFKADLQPVKAQAPRQAGRAVSIAPHGLLTVEALFHDWFLSRKFQIPANPKEAWKLRLSGICYAKKTAQDYRWKASVIEKDHMDIWTAPAQALTTAIVHGLFEELLQTRGLATARSTILTLSTAMSWAMRRGHVRLPANPCLRLGMASPAPRIRYATRAELNALTASADALGWPEMGDSFILAVWTGQRQADRLALIDHGLKSGRRIFKQFKTGEIVAIRQAPQVEARLAMSRARRAAHGIGSPHIILNEKTWQPFGYKAYNLAFNAILAHAAAACPSLAGGGGALAFHEADLRDTAVTWLALAGATIPEICAISGHSLASATRILKHYLAAHPQMADAGIGKMIAWDEAGGETETGL